MKNFIIKALPIFVLAITSVCSEDSIIENTNKSNYLQEISITGKNFQFENETRSSVTISDKGASFTWDEDDVIGIFPNKSSLI